MSEARTIVTGPMRAVSGPHTTAIERRGTLPLTPSPSASASAPGLPPATAPVTAPILARSPAPPRTDEITAARPRAPEAPAEPPPIRAVSASENPREALESYHGPRENDYDKLVGQTLDGRYYVQKKIGEGGMGVVFSARHAVIERPLAIKVLKREVMRDTATIRRFVQEAKAASRIGHPNIVDVTDFGTTPDGMTYSVMEYVKGQTLGAALRHGAPFPMERTIRIAAQIARALGAAHDKGIIHRDLKPENVFLIDREGRTDFVKIVDFGIAKVTPLPGQSSNEPRLTRAGSVFGTPEYMAPEQAAGRGDTDGRVDIYALGVILYEMVTGRVPHRGDSMVRTLAMQMLDPAEPPSKVRPDLAIHPELEALIMKALAKKREHRFPTMGELLAGLDRLQTPVGLSVTGSPVYGLVPLPPGADPALVAGIPPTPGPVPIPVTPGPGGGDASVPIHVPQSIDSPQRIALRSAPAEPGLSISSAGGSGPLPLRARTPTGPAGTTRRLRDEPEFVTHERPLTFDHVFSDEHAAPRRRRWPLLLLFGLILGGASGVVALVLESRSRVVPGGTSDLAAPLVPDAAAVASAGAPDAAVPDVTAPADATAVVVAEDPPDAGVRIRPRPPGSGSATIAAVASPRIVQIQVLTKPEGATLFDSAGFRGHGGTHLAEPFGTRLEVTCKHPGFKAGTVKLVFDGKREAEFCVLERIVVCIPGVKNPFDQCPD